MIDAGFWRNRRVFLTGHTGFKGAWMSLILAELGAEVHGYALAPGDRDLFVVAGVERDVHHQIGDVRDLDLLRRALSEARADIVIHMAAQALVRKSYVDPVETYATNVMGTVNLLEAVRACPTVRAVIVVTSDKCYDNAGWVWGYRETDQLGGHDPYSNSKGCAELVTDAYRKSYFSAPDAPAIASCRAGNVIGGGDWSLDRLVPDAIRAFMAGEPLRIRYPNAVRPWQHVFDPVIAYLMLAERLVNQGHAVAESWNFGPSPDNEVPVRALIDHLIRLWGAPAAWTQELGEQPHEASYLKLDCTKARSRLGWRPLFEFEPGLRLTAHWYRAVPEGGDLRALSLQQIHNLLDVHVLPRQRCATES